MPVTTTRRRFLGRSVRALGLLGCAGRFAAAAGPGTPAPSVEAMTDKAVAFLRSRQGPEGGWSTEREPGITALVATALLRSKRVKAADPVATKAFGYLERFLSPNGGLSEVPHANYATAIALMAFK